MHVLHESRTRKYPDVLAGIVHELREGHRLLLDSLVEAEQALLADLERSQKQIFWRYKEILDELQTLYQLAAYEAGRKAAADLSAEALEHAMQILPQLLAAQQPSRDDHRGVPGPGEPRL